MEIKEYTDFEPILISNLLLDKVGEVVLTHNSDGLSWICIQSSQNDTTTTTTTTAAAPCLRSNLKSKVSAEIKFTHVYAVEVIDYGLIHEPKLVIAGKTRIRHELCHKMYRFSVHGFQSSESHCVRVPVVYTFGHKDSLLCEMWVNHIDASLKMKAKSPKSLLVFVHPMSGKEKGCKTWEFVAPIFSRAKIKTKVTVTQRAGHAFDVMEAISNEELSSYDGVIAVGGDGFFNEILNGFLSSRYNCSVPPAPSDFLASAQTCHSEAHHLLLPNENFRFGIIPAGSSDAIVMCTTGARDPITSALHIVMGKRVNLDIAQVIRWRITSQSNIEPFVRYAASFVGYGFYGDVIKESEKYRWMGPKRYDYAGTKVFMKHRAYEAEIAYLGVEQEKKSQNPERGLLALWGRKKSERVICRVNCKVCNNREAAVCEERRWLKSKGRFLSVGAAIMSNRNERAPDGLVADAHLSDGFLHLILIKECPRASYLWHLTQLAKKGADPLDFEFVEHHKTAAFTFTSSGTESVWNLDGELFRAHQLSAQVLKGFVSLFASGPDI
ncbi:hypothetical protein ACFE04_004636 [Oxalis oulophora]